jgi:hypothetical protein
MSDTSSVKDPRTFAGKRVLMVLPSMGFELEPEKWLGSFLGVYTELMNLGCHVGTAFPWRMPWEVANNLSFDLAREQHFDYIIRMDDDVWGYVAGGVTKLLKADVPVIGAAYPKRHYPYSWCALLKEKKSTSLIDSHKYQRGKFHAPSFESEGVVQVDLIGFGLTVIKVEAIKDFPMRPFTGMTEVNVPDDTWFCEMCENYGVPRYVHMDVRLHHREVTGWNMMRLHQMHTDWEEEQKAKERSNVKTDSGIVETGPRDSGSV